jgi:MFS family permease
MANGETIESYVPARLDRLPWSSWHWLIVVSLGATWILDGLEVTLAGALGGILTLPQTLGLTPTRVGASATCYLAGAVLGALLFGYGTDRFGRKKLFFITVAVYLIGTALSAFSWNFWSYAFFRAVTGAGIGGEYAAINSAIDELIPARVRGRVDLIINGSYWVGAALGAAATLVLLDPRRIPIWLGWRLAFGIGATLGLIVIFFRRWIPESPRWLKQNASSAKWNERLWAQMRPGSPIPATAKHPRVFGRAHIRRGTRFGTQSYTNIAGVRSSVLC